MLKVGSIICIRGYLPKPNGDKLFVVVGDMGEELNLLAITTSQMYFDPTLFRHGIIEDRANKFYGIPKGLKIGTGGFSFNKDTIFSLQSKLIPMDKKSMEGRKIYCMDVMESGELLSLLLFYHDNIQMKYREHIDSLIELLKKDT